jgi:hypothetical protein
MHPIPKKILDRKPAQITDLAHDRQPDPDRITAGIPFFEPFK